METATVLRVRNWDTHYENNRTRDYKKLNWVPIPNRMDGDGYTELVDHPNGAAHLGAWVAIVQVASRCTPRGALMRESGQPHNAESLARITRLPVDVFAEATLRLLKIGWLEEIPQNTATIPQLPATIPQSKYAEQNRTEQNRTSNTCASGDARVTDSPTAEPKKHTKPNREMTPQRESWFTAWWDAYWLH
ncbi:MAG: hypothetical protein LAQ30_26485, partial [Acidobacteriia bacterium]|nr:hypothetical protein [Terriglobia bacterium]